MHLHSNTPFTPQHRQKRAVRVARVSTLDQEVYGTSIEDQLAKCAMYAQIHDMDVVDDGEYSGDESGTLPLAQRAYIQKLLADARARKFDVVIWHKIDRMARSARAILEIWAALEDLGVTVIVIEPAIDSSDQFGRLMRTILAAFAEFERDMIVARTSGGHVRKATRGEVYLPRGKYGYTYVPKAADDPHAGKVRKNEAQARVVVRIFQRKAQKATPGRIAQELTAEGVLSPRGKPYWHSSTVRLILDDRAYLGTREWGRTRSVRSKNGKRVSRPAVRPGKPIELSYPPIIEQALWDAAHEPACLEKRPAERCAPGTYLLGGGRLWCVEHDHGMHGGTGGHNCRQYRCVRPNGKGGRATHCLPAKGLEEAVWDELMRFMLDPERGLRAAKRLAQEAEVDLARISARRGEIAKERAEVAGQRRWVLTTARKVGATEDEIKEQMADLGQQDERLLTEDRRLAAQEELARDEVPQAEAIARTCRLMHERAQTMERPELVGLLEDLEVRVEVEGEWAHITGKVKEMERWVPARGATVQSVRMYWTTTVPVASITRMPGHQAAKPATKLVNAPNAL
jgi:site-specific DNA recombinase